MAKIRKGKQLSLINPKNAGRPAIHDKGIRHTKREEILKPRPLRLTIKLKRHTFKMTLRKTMVNTKIC